MSNESCYTLFQRDDFKDVSGCLKTVGHLDHHVCKTSNGSLMAWDYDWDCTCRDCRTDEISDMCIIYWEVNSINE